MSILLGVLAALAYGVGDFLAGVAGRRLDPAIVTALIQLLALALACCAVLAIPADGPSSGALTWAAVAGVGAAVGSSALYRGLARNSMAIVATISGLGTAVFPVAVGLMTGDSLSGTASVGVVIAVPAIVLVSWQGGPVGAADAKEGVIWGLIAGGGFSLYLVGLDRAGTDSGAWPLVVAQAVSAVITGAVAYRLIRPSRPIPRVPVALAATTGILAGIASLAFVYAASEGGLSLAAVLTSMFPGVTVVLARVFLAERWSTQQKAGLLGAAAAVVLISVGGG